MYGAVAIISHKEGNGKPERLDKGKGKGKVIPLQARCGPEGG